MSKAEQRALEEYPVYEFNGIDWNASQRETYCKGYDQAEKEIKQSLLQWLEYTRNLWSQTIPTSVGIRAIQMVIDKVKEDEK